MEGENVREVEIGTEEDLREIAAALDEEVVKTSMFGCDILMVETRNGSPTTCYDATRLYTFL